MKLPRLLARKKGFTLVELLTVIAIIGILAAMVIPGVQRARRIAQKMTAGSNCSQIAKSYSLYANGGTNPRSISQENVSNSGGGVTGWAVYLAAKTQMNNADLWFIKQDPALEQVNVWPQQVADLVNNPSKPSAQGDFQSIKPKSWAVVVNAAKNADASTYPIIWTRGLQGTMWAKESPWGTEGGHVAYLDGHSVSIENTEGDDGKGVFIDAKTGKPTSDIKQAIRSSQNSTSEVLEDSN